MMPKTSERFHNAITRLYSAFHTGELNAYSCEACAVGNICSGSSYWASVIGAGNKNPSLSVYDTIILAHKSEHEHSKHDASYTDQNSGYLEGLRVIKKSGYSSWNLYMIECIFLNVFDAARMELVQNYNFNHDHARDIAVTDKEIQFKALCAVIEYLCELEGIDNVMDYTKLFEFDKNRALNECVV